MLKHCRFYGWKEGDCRMLTCSRCGKLAFARLRAEMLTAAHRHPEIFFLTVYFDPRWLQDLSHLPMFADHKTRSEKTFRDLTGKVFRALRDKARRSGCRFEYLIVFALSRVKHRIHKVLHFHALLTWLPDLEPHKTSKKKERLQSRWLEKKLAGLHLLMWLEKPRSVTAVARYTMQNAKTVIGKKEYKNVRIYRTSEGWKK